LTYKEGTATKPTHGILCGTFERFVSINEFAVVYKDPSAHVMSFEIFTHGLIGCDFSVEIGHILVPVYSDSARGSSFSSRASSSTSSSFRDMGFS
jgi:hypothetical protein